MKAGKHSLAMAVSAFVLMLHSSGSKAQQVTGEVGSPGATTTITGKQLPPPDPAFGGVIKEKASELTPWWAPRIVPPKGAPNVLLIMTDDQGFGAPSTFGGVIPTPAMDRIANSGLRYTNFHSTSLCSPTRAALITGRNHHSVGFGVVGEIATGFPGYDSIIPLEKGTIGTILKDNGYATSWFGKDHNTPSYQSSQAGPFEQWPTGMGFDYFYGFVGGDASQWQPNLFRNTTAIYPFEDNPGWNLETAMADEAIQYMKQLKELAPGKPWLVQGPPQGREDQAARAEREGLQDRAALHGDRTRHRQALSVRGDAGLVTLQQTWRPLSRLPERAEAAGQRPRHIVDQRPGGSAKEGGWRLSARPSQLPCAAGLDCSQRLSTGNRDRRRADRRTVDRPLLLIDILGGFSLAPPLLYACIGFNGFLRRQHHFERSRAANVHRTDCWHLAWQSERRSRARCPHPSLARFELAEPNRDELPNLKLPRRILVDDSQHLYSSDPTGRTMRPPGLSCSSKAGGVVQPPP